VGSRNLNWQCYQVWPLRFSESGEPVHGSRHEPCTLTATVFCRRLLFLERVGMKLERMHVRNPDVSSMF
jgi:hypothetical protein